MLRKERYPIYIRRTIFAVIILAVTMLQGVEGLIPEIFGVRAMPLIPLVVCIGMFERESAGAAFGLFAGALWDITVASGSGFNTIVLFTVGCLSGLMIRLLMRNNLVTALLLSGIGIVLRNFIYWLIFLVGAGIKGASKLLVTFFLPSSLYSIIFILIFYFIIRKISKNFRLLED